MDADEIVTGLWQGSVPPRGSLVHGNGFDTLVLCAREFQFPAHEFPGTYVVHAPNDDAVGMPLTREKLRVAIQAARIVVQEIGYGRRVLVTCAAGLNRSGLVVALALHLLFGWSGDDCIHRVRRQRHTRSPMKPLSNGEFNEVLQRLPTNFPTVFPIPISEPVQPSFQL
jgi:protein-tyrosine phosphatase